MMTEDYRESQDIPQRPYLIFGDGLIAQIVKGPYYRMDSELGYEVVDFVLIPSDDILHKYDIGEEFYNEVPYGRMRRTYRADIFVHKGIDPSIGRVFILCDFNGNEDTPLFYKFVAELLRKSLYLQEENRRLKLYIAKLKIQNRYLVGDTNEFIRQQLGLIKEVKKFAKIDYNEGDKLRRSNFDEDEEESD